jgi:hypothetical protein
MSKHSLVVNISCQIRITLPNKTLLIKLIAATNEDKAKW